MEKVLSQGEIDALFRAAGGDAAAGESSKSSIIEPWDLHQAGLLSKEHLHSVSQLHESFARNLTSAMSGYLRDKFEAALVAVEQLAYRDLLARLPEVTYYGTFLLPPGDACGILHLDLSLAFPIVDLLLGGPGEMPKAAREVTEIEENILEGVGHIVCHELQPVWQPLGLELTFEKRQSVAYMLRMMPPQEKTLTLTFEVTMTQSKGMLNIAFPSAVSSAMLRKLGSELVYQRARGPAVKQESLRNRLRGSAVAMELATPLMAVKLPELLGLQPGGVLSLRRPIDEPAELKIQGRPCWRARPVGSGRNFRAAQLLEEIVQPEPEEKR